jgi:hypothetical protein
MSTPSNQPGSQDQSQNNEGDETFTTDISETDDEGTSVREAEVRKDDLSETKPTEGDSQS